VLAKQLRGQVYLSDIGDILEVELLVELNLELRFQIIGTKVEFYLWVFVSSYRLLLVDDGVGEAGVEGVVKDALGLAVACGTV
jgi:hypothetical protein